MNLRDFHFNWMSTNTSYLFQALLLVYQLKSRPSVKNISLSGDKLDHRNQKVSYIEKEKENTTIWVPCEDSNLKQSAQIKWSQLDGGFRALHSVLVYILVPKRGAVKITHGELCEMIISGRLLWGLKPQIYRFCCQILYLLTFFKIVPQIQKRLCQRP